MKRLNKGFLFWAFFILLAISFFQYYENKKNIIAKDFNYPKFLQSLKNKQVTKDTIIFNLVTNEISGEFNESGEKTFGGKKFLIQGNVNDKGFEIIRSYGITPSYVNKDNSIWLSILSSWIPLLLFVGIFIFFIRQLQAGGNKALSFGKHKARLVLDKNKASFKDVAGIEEAKGELKEVVEFLRNPKKFTKLGGEIPKGILLIGAPGTGKTLLARAVAGEAKVPFFTISGSDFVEMFVGVGASRVRNLFAEGKKNAPCLIFIDEIDAVGRQRGSGMGGGHDEREQTLNQLLVEMDGFDSHKGIILIAATNRPDVLDPALLRPGRFDRRVVVNLPNLNGREEILQVHTKKTPLDKRVSLRKIARGTPGFSGADLKNLINEASLLAASKNQSKVMMDDLEEARDKVLMGSERKSFAMSENDRKITSYHEAGHALVGLNLPFLDPVYKVTIVPRGMALGMTQTLPKEDMLNMSKKKAKNTLAFLFGGRAAEELIFKDFTSGASNDIVKASDLAYKMVSDWGMSTKIGPINISKKSSSVFVHQNEEPYACSEESAREVDREIMSFINEAYHLSKKILKDNLDKLHVMAKALLEFETIDSKEIKMINEGKTAADIKRYREEQVESSKNENEDSKKKSSDVDDSHSPSLVPETV